MNDHHELRFRFLDWLDISAEFLGGVTMRLVTLFAIVTALCAQTGTVTLTWDPKPAGQTWQKVRVYERSGTAPDFVYTQKAEVSGIETTATVQNVTPGVHTYVARSVDGWESVDSNASATPAEPTAPSGLKITVTVVVTVP